MITKQRTLFYFVGTTPYANLADAQKADLMAILPTDLPQSEMADWLLANASEVARILTTTPRSRNRKPRKDKGVTRKSRTPVATVITP